MRPSQMSQSFCSMRHLFGCSSLWSVNNTIIRKSGDLSYWCRFFGCTNYINILKEVFVRCNISLNEIQCLNWLRVICIRVEEWGSGFTTQVASSWVIGTFHEQVKQWWYKMDETSWNSAVLLSSGLLSCLQLVHLQKLMKDQCMLISGTYYKPVTWWVFSMWVCLCHKN
jgi:hypothetical protein